MRAGIALLIVVAAAAGLVWILSDDGDAGEAGEDGVATTPAGSTYLGPGGDRTGWVPSRTKRVSVVWAVGDAADGRAPAERVASMIASRRVDRLLYLGDVYETGTAEEYEANYRPVFGRFDRIAAPTIGNHEWPNVATGYVPYWTAARGAPPPFWYAFAASGWQLISLNSNEPALSSPEQLAWLRGTISKAPRYGDCRIAFFHHPRYSAGLHGGLSALEPMISVLEGRAVIALSGHDHDLQRLRPLDGITQLVSGAGGAELYPVNPDDPRLVFSDDTHHGALRLKLTPGRAVASFLSSKGALLDRSVIRCAQSA